MVVLLKSGDEKGTCFHFSFFRFGGKLDGLQQNANEPMGLHRSSLRNVFRLFAETVTRIKKINDRHGWRYTAMGEGKRW